jgi:dolichol-phosphate mannosyltransferase
MRVFVTIPTFNEKENIGPLIAAIRRLGEPMAIVVADDDSPDGTWREVARIAAVDGDVFLLHRTRNKGRGSAGAEAFQFALDHGADVVLEMDADFSHDPALIPRLLEEIRHFDLVIGSRHLAQASDERGSLARRWLTAVSSRYARTVLALPVGDCNSGYRCFRRRVLESIGMDSIISTGPSIVQELLYRAYLKGFSIGEIPIVFKDREAGRSQLNFKRLLQGFLMVLRLRAMHQMGKI